MILTASLLQYSILSGKCNKAYGDLNLALMSNLGTIQAKLDNTWLEPWTLCKHECILTPKILPYLPEVLHGLQHLFSQILAVGSLSTGVPR